MRKRAAKIGETLIAFADRERRDFATAFHAAAPRDIRDLVYALLGNDHGVGSDDDRCDHPIGCVCKLSPGTGYAGMGYGVVIDTHGRSVAIV